MDDAARKRLEAETRYDPAAVEPAMFARWRATHAFAVELSGTGIRINTIEPRAAVMSEGAEALVGGMVGDEAIESMEAMVEATLVLCDCPAERTGGLHVSLDLLDELGLTVMTIDATAPYPGGQRVVRA